MARPSCEHPWHRTALAVVLVVAIAGCGGSGQAEVGRGQYTIYVHDDWPLPRGGSDALLGGTLVTRDGCVLLGQEDGVAYPVVWPSGTSIVDDDPLTLRLRTGERVTVGGSVSGGGGFYDADEQSQVKVDIDEACLADAVTEGSRSDQSVMVFNPDADLDI